MWKTELCFQYQPVVETLLTSDHTGLPLVQVELLCLCYVLVSQNFPSFIPVALSAVDLSDIVAGQVGLICLPYFLWAKVRHEICGKDYQYNYQYN